MKKNGQFPNVRVEYGFGAVWVAIESGKGMKVKVVCVSKC